MADHREQALVAAATPSITQLGVEDLVPAVLGIGLREHHQLDVGRIAADATEIRVEVVDLVRREREAELGVGALDRRAALGEERDRRQRPRREMREQRVAHRRVTRTPLSVIRSCSSGSSAVRSLSVTC